MQKADPAGEAEDVQSGLLELAEVRLHELLSNREAVAASTLDGVMRRLFDPQNLDRSPISGFGSSL